MLDPFEMDVTYGCSQCSHQAASVFQLDHHIKTKHRYVIHAVKLFHVCAITEPEQFSCVHCDYRSHYHMNLYEHYKQTHEQNSTTNNENRSFRDKFKRYSCGSCKDELNSSLFLVKHQDVCKKTPLQDAVKEKRHVLKKSTKETDWFLCSHCSFRTRAKSSLKRHRLQHAPKEAVDWFKCDHCPYQALQRSSLKIHCLLKHATKEETVLFRCNRCPYSSAAKQNLKRHMVTHAADEEIQWFQCDQCSYKTKHKSYLKTHTLRHVADEEIEWFQCSGCPYRAKMKSSLKKHMLQHAANEEIEWFFCNRCSFQAKRKQHVKTHMLRRHGKDPDW